MFAWVWEGLDALRNWLSRCKNRRGIARNDHSENPTATGATLARARYSSRHQHAYLRPCRGTQVDTKHRDSESKPAKQPSLFKTNWIDKNKLNMLLMFSSKQIILGCLTAFLDEFRRPDSLLWVSRFNRCWGGNSSAAVQSCCLLWICSMIDFIFPNAVH